MLTVQDALEEIKLLTRNFGEEIVPIEEAYGRVISEQVYSDRDYPPFNRATMDGITINTEDFNSKNIKEFKVIEEVFAGSSFSDKIPEGHCVKIMTGAPVPVGANAVIKIEDTEQKGNKFLIKNEFIKQDQNIAKKGEDLQMGELVLKSPTLISPAEISTLAVLGKSQVKVFKHPTVAIVSTGNEVIPIDSPLSSFQIRDSNSYAIQAFFKKWGMQVSFKRLVKDDKDSLQRTLREALDHDIVITSGGVSMGDADFLPEVFDRLGVKKVFHKVQVKPGKPIWVGETSGSIVFGLPGNPVSVQIACKIFIEPFLRKCFGLQNAPSIKLPLISDRNKRTKFDEFFPCKVETKEYSVLEPLQYNGSGDITATLGSHGLALHPADQDHLEEGGMVEFFPW